MRRTWGTGGGEVVNCGGMFVDVLVLSISS